MRPLTAPSCTTTRIDAPGEGPAVGSCAQVDLNPATSTRKQTVERGSFSLINGQLLATGGTYSSRPLSTRSTSFARYSRMSNGSGSTAIQVASEAKYPTARSSPAC